MSPAEEVRRFVAEELSWPQPAAALADDLPLVARGAIDSLGLVQLVAFVESRFAIAVRPEDVVPRNFGTIGAIARFVEARRAAQEGRRPAA